MGGIEGMLSAVNIVICPIRTDCVGLHPLLVYIDMQGLQKGLLLRALNCTCMYKYI